MHGLGRLTSTLPRLPTGQSVSQMFTLVAQRSAAPLSTVELQATATYFSLAGVEG